MRLLIASALLLSALPALAQQGSPVSHRPGVPPYDPRRGYDIGAPSRDGCINVPGIPHNSADCSHIPANDYNTVMNTPSTDLSGRPTGATENAARNKRILSGEAID